LIGVILKTENFEKIPETEINGQNVLQYILLPQKPDSPIPKVNNTRFSPTIQYRETDSLIAGLLIDETIAPIKINPIKYENAMTSFLFLGCFALGSLS
jgi:hypothetical protein